jgi:predicted AAA+ superfamily ATPase
MFYQRTIYPALEKELYTKENIVLTGMRQVGKTTLLTHLFSQIESTNKVMLDFENPLNRKVFEEENYDAIWQNLAQFGLTKTQQSYIFLDEIQHLPNISSVAKYLSDHYPVKFFLTGSSSYYIKNVFPESMAGRKLLYELYPLTFSEFLAFKEVKREVIADFREKENKKNKIGYELVLAYYKEYMQFGGFPKVVLAQSEEKKKLLLLDIFTSYFEKDVKTLADIKDTAIFRDVILLLVSRIGSKVDVGKIANALSISRETVYSYLAFLEKTYFIALLPKFTTSIDRQTAGIKKVFFCDTGLATILGTLSEGQLFEQSIFETLRPHYNLSYYQNESGGEIDFILNKQIALEVKLHASKQDIEFLNRRAHNLPLKESYVVSLDFTDEKQVVLASEM